MGKSAIIISRLTRFIVVVVGTVAAQDSSALKLQRPRQLLQEDKDASDKKSQQLLNVPQQVEKEQKSWEHKGKKDINRSQKRQS